MPVQLTIRVRDHAIKTVNAKLLTALRRIPAGIVRPEIDTARDELRTYPPELPNQRYVRTGKRYRATRVEYLGGQSYRLISDPSYKGRSADPYVLGDAYGQGQARIHQGRWALIKDVVEKSIERILTRVREEFNRILTESGPGGP